MSDTPRTDAAIEESITGGMCAVIPKMRALERELEETKALLPNANHTARGGMQADWWSVAVQCRRDLVAQRRRLEQAIRRLQYMHSAHSDSVNWYKNSIAQALKSIDALPDKLEF